MFIPDKIKIGAHIYKIKQVDGMLDNANKNSEKEHLILLNERLCETEKEVTLFHEIFHAINSEMSEATVEFLAQGIYQVLRDNNMLK